LLSIFTITLQCVMVNMDNNSTTGAKTNMSEQTPNNKNFTEQVEVAGNQLVDRVKEIIQEGNVRRLIIRDQDGKALIEIPLTVGAVVGGALAMFYPVLAGLGAIAALVARVTIEIVREEPENIVDQAKEAVDEAKQKVDEATDRLSGQ
jgi:Domain of unknown function (DUF4342)